MNASQFAGLLRAKRSGRGKWTANCPVHEGDGHRHRPSLSIAEGRKSPIVFKCMTGCDQKSILESMGLTWQSILGDRDVTKEMRGRWADEKKLEDLEHDLALFSMLRVIDVDKTRYWDACERNSIVKIQALRDKLYPDEVALIRKRERVHRTIEKYGWNEVWAKFESTERGKSVIEKYGVTHE